MRIISCRAFSFLFWWVKNFASFKNLEEGKYLSSYINKYNERNILCIFFSDEVLCVIK